jgi:hypothetical protein
MRGRGISHPVGPLQLSILIPTNRRGLQVHARLLQACSWAGPEVEVIVRDNSGDTQKREFLSRIDAGNCNIIIADPCDPATNFAEIIRLAKGEYILQLSDDDFCFDRAMQSMPAVLSQVRSDQSVIGVTGAFAIESSAGSSVVGYPDVDSEDLQTRVNAYLKYEGVNTLMYAPVRRDVVERSYGFLSAMPTYFSFHDQIQCLLYLMNGRFFRMKRLMYGYDVGPWEAAASAQRRDLEFYKNSGMDPAINKLHWFLCGFEGALLVRNSALFPECGLPQRQKIADLWFATMFSRFNGHERVVTESGFNGEADTLCNKLRTSTGQLTFQNMLAETCGFIALFSPERAQRYFDFWATVLTGNLTARAS